MDPRFVTKSIPALLDYPVAVSLMATPFLLGLGTAGPAARWLSFGAGAAALVLTIFTDHRLGAFRVLPFRLHLAADLLVGMVFLAAPTLMGFSGVDAWYFWANGAAVLLVVSLHKPETSTDVAASLAPATPS